MPEGDQQQDSLGWRAGLPDDLKAHESLVPFKTVGDFAKSHIETATKLKSAEGKLSNSIPKLGPNATPEERNQYLTSLGRPEKPDGYELAGEDRNAKEWTGFWRGKFHEIGVPKDMAKSISEVFDQQTKQMVDGHNAALQRQFGESEAKLKTEWGDKYDANVQLVSRLWKRDTDTDLDQAFKATDGAARHQIMRYVFKMAAKTGEDISERSSGHRGTASGGTFITYDKSPAPPQRAAR